MHSVNIKRTIWLCIPLLIAVISLLFVVSVWLEYEPTPDEGKLPNGNLTEAQKEAINLATEFNDTVIYLNTLLFGVLGFYITQYKKEIQSRLIGISYLLCLILFGFTFFFTFKGLLRIDCCPC